MWLLPPDFPEDAFDLPPGTWALPWYANEGHIDALMRLLVAGEARIREWLPLPWAAVEGLGSGGQVRHGAALVLQVPAELEQLDAAEDDYRASRIAKPEERAGLDALRATLLGEQAPTPAPSPP